MNSLISGYTGNIVGHNVAATMCPRFPGALPCLDCEPGRIPRLASYFGGVKQDGESVWARRVCAAKYGCSLVFLSRFEHVFHWRTYSLRSRRGDHTSVDSNLAILPPKTEAVVFSIDGSFTTGVSLRGKDPKVRAGSVDVVRWARFVGRVTKGPPSGLESPSKRTTNISF